MRIFDVNDNEIQPESVDYDKGYLKDDKLFIAHHEAVEAVEEQGHYETVAEYRDENGEVYGSDVAWVVDVPGVEGSEAWDEYEDIQRYIEYTPEELAEREAAKQEAEERAAREKDLFDNGVTREELEAENKLLREQVNALSAQAEFQEECIVEMAMIVYA